MLGHWNRLPEEVVTAPSLTKLKMYLDNSLRHMMGFSGCPGPEVGFYSFCGSILTQDILLLCANLKCIINAILVWDLYVFCPVKCCNIYIEITFSHHDFYFNSALTVQSHENFSFDTETQLLLCGCLITV